MIVNNTYYTGATGSGGGRGDIGSPIIVEYRFPRDDTETFNPFVVAVEAALVAFGASCGVRAGVGCSCCPDDPGPGLEFDDSTVPFSSVVSLSYCTESSSDGPSSAAIYK
jgi:hypothetical protein